MEVERNIKKMSESEREDAHAGPIPQRSLIDRSMPFNQIFCPADRSLAPSENQIKSTVYHC
jgi:hypothetical protein